MEKIWVELANCFFFIENFNEQTNVKQRNIWISFLKYGRLTVYKGIVVGIRCSPIVFLKNKWDRAATRPRSMIL